MGLFTDRERGVKAPIIEEMPLAVWAAIVDLIDQRVSDGSLGLGFPEFCGDGAGCCGTDGAAFFRKVEALIPDLELPLRRDEVPEIGAIMDLIEFVAENIGEPDKGAWHDYYNHHHLSHDREAGLAKLVSVVNRLFNRNGMAYCINEHGRIERIGPGVLMGEIRSGFPETGEEGLDRLLRVAVGKFKAPRLEMRREALEVIWDAYERLKTIDDTNKKTGVAALLDIAAGGDQFRAFLEADARSLTAIGNNLQIRHHETDKEPVGATEEIDYLFHKVSALILLLLKCRARA
ncbi:AbiJ-NTD4 domain-containing protein [Terasakiella pusilla]|uniref:AbiJ-NTD4 domain-containing protein n=1 Tax=Terasakiella pusilla TaxID=64973 RepID=UPI003AA8C957